MLSNWVTRIEGLDKSILRKYFTVDSPLGPLDASRVVDGSVIELLTDRELLLLHGQHTSPSIVIGRRGSGKTSYLRRLQIENPTSPFIELRTSRTFNALVSAMTEAASDGVTAELLADVWDAIFWIVLAWKVHSSGRPRIGLIKVREHVKALGLDQCHSFDAVTDRLGRIFALARQADGDFAIDFVLSMLSKGASLEDVKSLLCRDIQEQGLHAFIVMDSLDDYPLDVVKFRKALAGLLKCAGRFNSVETPYQVRLCLPAELYWEFVDEISSNSAKDFSNQAILHWPVGELLVVASRRLMIFLFLFHEDIYARVRNFPLETRSDAQEFLLSVFPKTLENLAGRRERTIEYLLRHTQLLPRQLLMYLTEIVKINGVENRDGKHGNELFSESSVRLGIRDTEDRVCQAIWGVFKHRYPSAQEVCKRLIPALPRVFTNDDLRKVVSDFSYERSGKTYNGSVQHIKRLLIEIGAVGKVWRTTQEYVEGRFEYALAGSLPVSEGDSMCLHPVFQRTCDSIRKSNREIPVLPLSSDLT